MSFSRTRLSSPRSTARTRPAVRGVDRCRSTLAAVRGRGRGSRSPPRARDRTECDAGEPRSTANRASKRSFRIRRRLGIASLPFEAATPGILLAASENVTICHELLTCRQRRRRSRGRRPRSAPASSVRTLDCAELEQGGWTGGRDFPERASCRITYAGTPSRRDRWSRQPSEALDEAAFGGRNPRPAAIEGGELDTGDGVEHAEPVLSRPRSAPAVSRAVPPGDRRLRGCCQQAERG